MDSADRELLIGCTRVVCETMLRCTKAVVNANRKGSVEAGVRILRNAEIETHGDLQALPSPYKEDPGG